MNQSFDLRVVSDDEHHVIYVRGDLDVATARDLKFALSDGITSSAPMVRVDLHDVPFIDSTGVKVLLEALVALEREGRTLCVSRPGPRTAHTIELCHVTDRLRVTDVDAGPNGQ